LVIAYRGGLAIVPGETVLSEAERLLAAPAGPAGVIGIEVQELGKAMSSDASPLRNDVFSAVTRVVQKLHPGVPVVPDQASGATDGLVFRAAGIPTYGVGGIFMRPKDDFSHGLNERIPVEGFYSSLDHWYLLLKDLAGRGR